MNIRKRYFLPILLSGNMMLSAQSYVDKEARIPYYEQIEEAFFSKNYFGCVALVDHFSAIGLDRQRQETLDYYKVVSLYYLNASRFEHEAQVFIERYKESGYKRLIYFYRGLYCFDSKRYDEAIVLLEGANLSVTLSGVDCDRGIYYLGLSYLNMHQSNFAQRQFEKLLNRPSEYRDAAGYYMGFLAFRDGNYKIAIPYFEKAMQIDAFTQDAEFYLAQTYYLMGEYATAESMSKSFLSRYANSKYVADANRIYGGCLFMNKKYSESIVPLEYYMKATKEPLKNANYALGVSYYHVGRTREAINCLEQSIGEPNKQSQSGYFFLGVSLSKENDSKKARLAFEQAAQMDFDPEVKELASYNYALAIHESSYSVFNESVTAFQNFLNQYPHSRYRDQAGKHLVEVYMTTKNYESALASIQKIAKPTADIVEAKQRLYFQLGTQKLINSRIQEAISMFSEALKVNTNNRELKAKSYYWRGDAYYKLENYEAAVRNFSDCLEIIGATASELQPLAYYNLGYSYFKMNQLAKALAAFEKCRFDVALYGCTLAADVLNRKADIYYYRKEFAQAERLFSDVVLMKCSGSDYALYQQAMMLGHLKQNNAKISLLDLFLSRNEKSEFYDDVLFEISATQMYLENYSATIETSKRLIKDLPQSPLSQKAALQIAVALRNLNDNEKAIEAYKSVMKNYSGSDEAKVANNDLLSICKELNKVDEYTTFIDGLDGRFAMSVGQRDELTFNAAERLFLKGEYSTARSALEKYLQAYSQGSFVMETNYYLAEICYESKDWSNAANYFSNVLKYTNSRYSEIASSRLAEILFTEKKYDQAYQHYQELSHKSQSKEQTQVARLGMLRSALFLQKWSDVVASASALLGDETLDPSLKTEALALRAKGNLAQNRIEQSQSDWILIADDTRNAFGAEAKYYLSKSYFDQKKFDQAEKEVFGLIESGTPHQYWLAKGFLLLADIYLAKGDKFQAKQYLLSLKNNYKGDAEIADTIDRMLKKCN